MLTVVRNGMWVVVQGRVGLVFATTPTGVTVDICHPYTGLTVGRYENVPYEVIRQAKWRNIPVERRPDPVLNEEWLIRRGYLTDEEVQVMRSPKPPRPITPVEFIKGD